MIKPARPRGLLARVPAARGRGHAQCKFCSTRWRLIRILHERPKFNVEVGQVQRFFGRPLAQCTRSGAARGGALARWPAPRRSRRTFR